MMIIQVLTQDKTVNCQKGAGAVEPDHTCTYAHFKTNNNISLGRKSLEPKAGLTKDAWRNKCHQWRSLS